MAPRIGTRAACTAAGVPQATWYRRHRISPPAPKPAPVPHAQRVQPRALAPAERTAILYVILDIFSRYAVGWMVATRESAALAEKLIAAACAGQGISRGQLSIHADRGSSMTSKPVALL